MKFGNHLRELLEYRGITQRALAEAVSISPSALGNYIHNQREPDFKTLLAISRALGVSTDFLLGNTVSELSHEDQLCLDLFHSMSPEKQLLWLAQGNVLSHFPHEFLP